MAIETFRGIEYSDEEKFILENGRIALREYSSDLLFYGNFDSTINGKYGIGDITATTTGTVTAENNGVFAQHMHVQNGYSYYNEDNFETLTNIGTLKFRLKTNFNNAPGAQSFVTTTTPEITSVPIITTSTSKFGGGSLNLLGNGEKRVTYNVNNLPTLVQTGTIDLFFKFNYTGTPTNDVMLFDLYNGTNNNDRIMIYHSSDGKLYFRIYNQAGVLSVDINFAWSATINWTNLSFNFDGNTGASRSFIDGIQYGTTSTATFTRSAIVAGYIGVGSSSGYVSNHYADDFAIFNTVQFTTNYTVRTVAYDGSETNLLIYADYNTSTDLDVGITTTTLGTYPINSNYEFKLAINGSYYTGGDIAVTLDTDDTLLDISNKIATALVGASVSVFQESAGNITIQAITDGDVISIEEPDTGTSLITLLGGTQSATVPNGPTVSTDIVEFYDGSTNANRITLTHTTNSNLTLKMYNSSGTLVVNQDFGVWSNNDITWYAFALIWNNTIGQFFIDGNLVGVFQTNFSRGSGTRLYFRAGTDTYRFDEAMVYNTYKHSSNYTVATVPLYQYSIDDPYIDINFGSGFKEDEVKDLNLTASINTTYIVGIDNNWYYYYAGAWRESDGTYSQSTTPSDIETTFSELYFNEEQTITIRAYFHSDGSTESWIDEIQIVTETVTESAASIVSTVDLTNCVNLISDQHVIITTDQGSAEVDVTTEVPETPAQHIGTADLSLGYAWATNGAETFDVNATTINLNTDTTTLAEIVTLIEGQLPAGVEVFTDSSLYIGLKTTATGPTATLDLVEGTGGLARLGMIDDTYTGALPDLSCVSLQQIIDAINAASVPGLAAATTDSLGHIVLQTTTTGTDAFISISNGSTSDALADVWGYEATDSGEEATFVYYDYTVIYDWIRSMLGAPTIPVELTDEQLENCVGRAVHWYNYYREAKEKLIYVTLNGDEQNGYTIPQEVGDEKNIIEIVVRPRFPFAYYTGGSVNSIMNNLYLQWMFQHGRNATQFKDFLGDYYITLSTEADYNIILGTQLKWNFYNGKIFISPKPAGLNIGIVYKSAVTIDEINTNTLIRSYALGEAKKILGTIRATFGGTIPGGTENIQLRGEAMIAEGQQEVQEALDKMMKLSEPLFLEWG